jgi:flagellar protein FliO/FliZ
MPSTRTLAALPYSRLSAAVLVLLAALLAPVSAAAQAPSSGSFVAELWRTALVLVIVIAMLLASLWLVKRFKAIPSQGAAGKVLQVIPVGPQERVVLLQLPHRQYLLGVTNRQISLIDHWPSGDQALRENELSVTDLKETSEPQFKS